MNEVFYTVQVGDCDRKFREGTTYLDIAKEYQHEYEHDIVLVFVDGRLQELFKTLKKDCKLEFVTTADSLGYKAYRRSMSLMLVKAVYDVAEHKNIDKVRIHYSVSKGYYCTIEGNIELTQETDEDNGRKESADSEKKCAYRRCDCNVWRAWDA